MRLFAARDKNKGSQALLSCPQNRIWGSSGGVLNSHWFWSRPAFSLGSETLLGFWVSLGVRCSDRIHWVLFPQDAQPNRDSSFYAKDQSSAAQWLPLALIPGKGLSSLYDLGPQTWNRIPFTLHGSGSCLEIGSILGDNQKRIMWVSKFYF